LPVNIPQQYFQNQAIDDTLGLIILGRTVPANSRNSLQHRHAANPSRTRLMHRDDGLNLPNPASSVLNEMAPPTSNRRSSICSKLRLAARSNRISIGQQAQKPFKQPQSRLKPIEFRPSRPSSVSVPSRYFRRA
jgi:hypothetical protein